MRVASKMTVGVRKEFQERPIDGRVARGARNRDAIVEAAVGLVRAGDLSPTADRVAAAAGVGVRSVFRHFEDLDGLFRAITERVEDEIAPLADISPILGSLNERVVQLVDRRVVVYEKVAPFRRSARVFRSRSTAIRTGHSHLDEWHRDQLEKTLVNELEGRPPELIEMLDATASFETWDRLRTDQGLSSQRAAEVMRYALLTAIAGAVATD